MGDDARAPHTISLPLFQRVIDQGDRFEENWLAGHSPQIEQYLSDLQDPERGVLLRELVAIEVELRRGKGDTPISQEYRGRFSGYAGVLASVFDDPTLTFDAEAGGHELAEEIGDLRRLLKANDLKIIRQLGSGGMGIVYQAYDQGRGEMVAVKTLKYVSASLLYRFKQEFRSLADVSHPNLVSYYELMSNGRDWFFTMEFVDGCDFLRYVDDGHWDETGAGSGGSVSTSDPGDGSDAGEAPEMPDAVPGVRPGRGSGWPAARLTRLRGALGQLAEGLSALHGAGKLQLATSSLSNVMVAADGRVVILDFGLVAELGRPGPTRARSGTPSARSTTGRPSRPGVSRSRRRATGIAWA